MKSTKLFGAAACALALSGCASFAPYPTRFQSKDVYAPPSTVDCSKTDKPDVIACLEKRAQAWERRGADIRGQQVIVGNASILMGASAIGLAATHGSERAITVLGLLTGAGVTQTSAYARPDQAKIAETAVSDYACLINEAEDWPSGLFQSLSDSNSILNNDLTTLEKDVAGTGTVFRPAVTTSAAAVQPQFSKLSPAGQAQANATITLIKASMDAGDSALGQINSIALTEPVNALTRANGLFKSAEDQEALTGSNLITQSSLLENQATAAMASATPDVAAVANSAPTQMNSSWAQFKASIAPPPGAPAPAPPAAAAAHALAARAAAPTVAAGDKPFLDELDHELSDANTYEAAADSYLGRFKAHIDNLNVDLATFQAALSAYKPPSMIENCTLSFVLPAFTSDPASPITADSHGNTSFDLVGGVAPQRFGRAPDGVRVSMTVISSTRSNVSVTGMTANGPWDIVFYDGSGTALTVHVQTPPKPAGQ